MTIWKHEMRQGRLSLLIWALAIGGMMALCVLVYPEMGNQMDEISVLFSQMGGFSAAFGMDRINMGEFNAFFGIECGSVLGIGGALYAGILGASALAKEENGHTVDFLFSYPISRRRVFCEKYLAVLTQMLLLNLLVVVICVLAMMAIDIETEIKPLALIFLSLLLMQCEIASITFGLSAFLRGGSLGLGCGFAALAYFLNMVANLVEKTAFLKYFTPFGYTESADIIVNEALDTGYLATGLAMTLVALAVGALWYRRKDMA